MIWTLYDSLFFPVHMRTQTTFSHFLTLYIIIIITIIIIIINYQSSSIIIIIVI